MALGTTTPLLAQPLIVTNQPANRVVWAGCSVPFSAGVSGAGPVSFQWELNGTNLTDGIISTVAGTSSGFSGDGGLATEAKLFYAWSVALDALGNMYIIDYKNKLVRKVNTSGIITTVAGGGTSNLPGNGNGGPATNATLTQPVGVAADNFGNFFISDDTVVRVVNQSGLITIMAGGGIGAGDGQPATNASLVPAGLALDTSGNLFIADQLGRICKVDTNGILKTVAGTFNTPGYFGDGGLATNALLNSPSFVSVDALGNQFIADSGNERIRKVDTNGIITTIAGNGFVGDRGDGGAATNASLDFPSGVWADSSGNVYIADTYNNRIRRVDGNGVIRTIAGNGLRSLAGDGGLAVYASLARPFSVVLDAYGDVFIADTFNSRVRKITNTQGVDLDLNEATSTNAGDYQLVASNSSGAITSAVAHLTVAEAPFIFGTEFNSNLDMTFFSVSPPGSTNVVLCATNLMPPVAWESVSTNIAGADGNWQYTDTNASHWPARFFRSLMN